jgi:hypothetical protein
MVIKQTFHNHIKVLWIAIFTTILYAVVLWFYQFERGALIIFLSGYVLTVVPSFYIHISYAIKNKGIVCQILPGKIYIVKNGKEQIIECNDIEEITVYKSASIEKGGIPITPMEAYFFVRIIDKGGNKYDLTCLLDTNIDKSIKIIGAVRTFVERGVFNTL